MSCLTDELVCIVRLHVDFTSMPVSLSTPRFFPRTRVSGLAYPRVFRENLSDGTADNAMLCSVDRTDPSDDMLDHLVGPGAFLARSWR